MYFCSLLLFSHQHSATFTKKMIEDNSAMDGTAQFLGVRSAMYLLVPTTYVQCCVQFVIYIEKIHCVEFGLW